MSALRLASQATNRSVFASCPGACALINTSLRTRNFRSTAYRKEQFFDADEQTFRKAISKESSQGNVVLVDFYADWCGPCRMLSPILEKITAPENAQNAVKTGSGRGLDLVTVNTDEQDKLAMTYGVTALPTVIAFKDGEPVEKFVGALPEKGVKDFVASL